MIGKTISHYKILEKSGEGGMGIVYKARDTTLDRDVALKFLPHVFTSDPAEKERFYHEARAAAALTHQNIAVVYEISEHEDPAMGGKQVYIAMEHVEGKTLKKLIGGETLSVAKVLDLAIQICDGLSAAHEKGVVHRDIKSENIMVTPKGQAKITDFGLAKLKGATKLTKAGSTLGTAAYMSPEQARGEEVDHRSDIFSFGVVLYELLAGNLPFRGEHEAALLYSLTNEEPPPLARYNEKVTTEFQHIVSKALEKDREDRYQHVDELLSDLRRERKHLEYAKSGNATARPPAEAPSDTGGEFKIRGSIGKQFRKKRLTKILSGVGIAILLAAAFFFLKPFMLGEALSSERRAIAVISFANQTGDKSFDYLQDAIPNLLITNLEQSKYLHVATWERLYDLMKQKGKADAGVIDRDMGFELCRMDGIEAIVLGSFTKAGDMFATDVKVLDVRTKQLLKSASSKGEGIGSILKTQIDELSKEISRGIGLSERKIASTPAQIAEYTTTSMDAYNYFLRGRDDLLKFYYNDARKYLERAVRIDSTFAAAHVYLALAYDHLNDAQARDVAYKKAQVFASKATEKERLLIESAIASNVENNPEKAYRLIKQVVDKYPKEKFAHFYLGMFYRNRHTVEEAIRELTIALELDPGYGPALNLLGYVYADIENYENAIECFTRYASVNPGDANPLDSMADLYFKMGKLDDAISEYKEVLDLRPDFISAYIKLAYTYFLSEKNDEGMKSIDASISKAPSPGLKTEGYWDRAIFAYYCMGRLRQAVADLNQSRELARSVGNEEWIVTADWLYGWILYEKGDTEACKPYFKRYFDYRVEHFPQIVAAEKLEYAYTLGLVAIKEKQIALARSKLREVETLLPKVIESNGSVAKHQRDLLHVELLLAQDLVDEAILACKKLTPSDLPSFGSVDMRRNDLLFIRDAAARAYLRKGDKDKAIVEYERLVAFNPKSINRRIINPKFHYLLAKLYEEKGWTEKATQRYEKFFKLWKNADTDLPELKDAKSRLAKLSKMK